MSSVLQPTGLRPQSPLGNGPYSGGSTEYPLTTNNTSALAVGDYVSLVGGSIVVPTASPSTTMSANSPVGVVLGIKYEDPVNPGRSLVTSQILPANAISNLNLKNVTVLVADDPHARFVVQADGSVPATALGKTVDLAIGTPDLVARSSRAKAVASTVGTTATRACKIVGFDRNQDNAPGDAYTKLIVKWNSGVHLYSLGSAQ